MPKNMISNPIFLGNFSCAEDVWREYEASPQDYPDIYFIYADYDTGDYQGASLVIFVRDGKLYEVNGSHCSCNGMEGLFEPEETTFSALMFRPNVPEAAKANLREYYKDLIVFA
jgi:hypothetical protein